MKGTPDATGLTGQRISVRTGGRLLLDGVDCRVDSGRTTALLGPNGAGKSTLLRALGALERPARGEVRADGRDLFSMRRRERARLAALVEQDLHTEVELSVRQVVELGRVPHEGLFGEDADGGSAVDSALDRAGVAAFADRAFGTLSGGERQRVALARALAQATPILLLDEPTNHLDIAAQLRTLRLLRDLAADGIAVIAALHDLSLAAGWADDVVVLDRGRAIAAGPTESTLTPELIERVYGVGAQLFPHPTTGRPMLAFEEMTSPRTTAEAEGRGQ